MAPQVVMDLNEVNKMLGLAWHAGDDDSVGLAVVPLADFVPGFRSLSGERRLAVALCTPRAALCLARGQVSGYASPVRLSFRLGDLREVCREAGELVLSDPHGLRAFETVALSFGRSILTVSCGGRKWRVRGRRFQFTEGAPR